MTKRENFQNIAWFHDLYNRELLNLDPPYQRRSVWNQSFKDYFIDTILLNYPAPAIFLYEEIDTTGTAEYYVVDGKQRLTTIFEFIRDEYPVSDNAVITELRGKFFDELSSEVKKGIWSYTFLVEYVPTTDESIINNIFDRINRNMARLTSQELRHARFSGDFITATEDLTDWMFEQFPLNFPRIAPQSRKQMKDVELVAQLFLLIEDGTAKGYSKDDLDEAFSDRDIEWEDKARVTEAFKTNIGVIAQILDSDGENVLIRSRLRNQADFYSLFDVIFRLSINKELPEIRTIKDQLIVFISAIDNEEVRAQNEDLDQYFFYTQSGVNRTAAREARGKVMKKFILGEYSSGNLKEQ